MIVQMRKVAIMAQGCSVHTSRKTHIVIEMHTYYIYMKIPSISLLNLSRLDAHTCTFLFFYDGYEREKYMNTYSVTSPLDSIVPIYIYIEVLDE